MSAPRTVPPPYRTHIWKPSKEAQPAFSGRGRLCRLIADSRWRGRRNYSQPNIPLAVTNTLSGYKNRRLTGYVTVNLLYFSCLKSNTAMEGGDQRRPGHQAENY